LQNDGVVYAELRFAPILNIRDLGNSRNEMEAMIAAAIEGVQASRTERFEARLILCCYRGFDTEYALETVELARQFREQLGADCPVVAIDLAGDESRYPAEAFRVPFDLARDYGIPTTVHASEAAGPESAAAALDLLHAQRIGHGIRIREDAALLDRVRRERIPLEVCLTSNLQTQTVESIQQHPFADYLRSGVCVTLNTDDPRVSGITLSSEWELAASAFGLAPAEIRQLAENSVEAAFCDAATKAHLRKLIAEGAVGS
jgi:adenosine deaminase